MKCIYSFFDGVVKAQHLYFAIHIQDKYRLIPGNAPLLITIKCLFISQSVYLISLLIASNNEETVELLNYTIKCLWKEQLCGYESYTIPTVIYFISFFKNSLMFDNDLQTVN